MPNAPTRSYHRYEETALEDPGQGAHDEGPRGPASRSGAAPAWKTHPIDIQVSIPFGFGRWYFTLVGGPERRGRERREVERRQHPLFTLGNSLFLFAV